jgi:hypothetical protein
MIFLLKVPLWALSHKILVPRLAKAKVLYRSQFRRFWYQLFIIAKNRRDLLIITMYTLNTMSVFSRFLHSNV